MTASDCIALPFVPCAGTALAVVHQACGSPVRSFAHLLRAGAAVLRHILCGAPAAAPAAAPAQRRSASLQANPFHAAPAGGHASAEEAHRAASVPVRATARSPRPPTSAALPAAGGGGGGAAAAAAVVATAALGGDWSRLSARLALMGQQVRTPSSAMLSEATRAKPKASSATRCFSAAQLQKCVAL